MIREASEVCGLIAESHGLCTWAPYQPLQARRHGAHLNFGDSSTGVVIAHSSTTSQMQKSDIPACAASSSFWRCCRMSFILLLQPYVAQRCSMDLPSVSRRAMLAPLPISVCTRERVRNLCTMCGVHWGGLCCYTHRGCCRSIGSGCQSSTRLLVISSCR
jgi:hypothetical protein